MSHCYLDAIVSLPDRTFFANFEHTYILAITKKHQPEDVQTNPVFTYLASNIGERLTSVKREEIDEDDLPEMERLFRIFSADKAGTRELLQKQSGRCKIWDIDRFQKGDQWVVDRWWSKAERIAIGAEEKTEAASKSEVEKLVKKFNELLADYDQYISADPLSEMPVREVSLGDKSLFHMFNGNRVIKKDTNTDVTLVPVYSANVFEPMGYIDADDEANNIEDFSHPSILWGIDGNFEFNLIPAHHPFATTDHCGTLMILNSSILPEYVLYAMTRRRIEESFDRGFRASLTNMRKFSIKIPITNGDVKFDAAAQKAIAVRFAGTQERRSKLEEVKNRLDAIFGRYVNTFHL